MVAARAEAADVVRREVPDAVLADFGHLGDGGLHLNVVLPDGCDPAAATALRESVYALVDRHGGSFSAEHGLGPANVAWWAAHEQPATVATLAAVEAGAGPVRSARDRGAARGPDREPEGHDMSTSTLPAADDLRDLATKALGRCGVDVDSLRGDAGSRTPVTGTGLLPLAWSTPDDVDRAVEVAHEAFLTWRTTPAPVRGALVKRLGELLREHLDDLADLVSLEVGKIRVGGARRGAGDGRHLRLRGRAVAPALRAGRCRRSGRATG